MNGRFGIDRYFINNVKQENIKVASLYKFYKKDLKYLLGVLWMEKFNLSFESLWYEDWKKEIKQYNTIIVSALNLNCKILSYIKNKNPKCRLIVWYWDTVNEKNILSDKYKEFCEVWSFDKEDCKKYHMNLNSQFYYPLDISKSEIVYDAMFIGRDKGRTEQINEMCGLFQKKGLDIYTYIQDDKIDRKWFLKKNRREIEYEEVVSLVAKSRCIIDIPKKGQAGITMRVLESIFYSKKLITTDSDIKSYEFYNKKNIFIWGEDDVEGIVDFINSDFVAVSEAIKNRYLFGEWLKRFR